MLLESQPNRSTPSVQLLLCKWTADKKPPVKPSQQRHKGRTQICQISALVACCFTRDKPLGRIQAQHLTTVQFADTAASAAIQPCWRINSNRKAADTRTDTVLTIQKPHLEDHIALSLVWLV